MLATESLDLINQIEERYAVDQWSAHTIPLWPILRTQLFFALRDALLRSTASGQVTVPRRRIVRALAGRIREQGAYLRAYLQDFRHNDRPNRMVQAVFLGDQYSRVHIEGSWYDRLCEPIIDLLAQYGISSFHLERYHDYRIPRHNASLYVQSHLDWLYLRSRLMPGSYPDVVGRNQDLCSCLEHLHALHLDIPRIDARSLGVQAAFIRSAADHFRHLLTRLQPSVAFVVEYYGLIGMAFILACREANITTVDIPHGNHGEIHAAYSRWNRVPLSGYSLLPSIFWCWSEDEALSIRKWTDRVSPAHRTLVGGSPWLSRWMNDDSPMVAASDLMARTIKSQAGPRSLHVLCTYEFDYADLVTTVKQSPPDWFWWIRVHPCRQRHRGPLCDLLASHGITNFDLDNATDLPLYALLRMVDVHLTEYSSSVIEAAAFGVPSVITREAGFEAFPAQVASGWAVAAFRPKDAVRALRAQKDRSASLPHCGAAANIDLRDTLASLFPALKDRTTHA